MIADRRVGWGDRRERSRDRRQTDKGYGATTDDTAALTNPGRITVAEPDPMLPRAVDVTLSVMPRQGRPFVPIAIDTTTSPVQAGQLLALVASWLEGDEL